METPLTPADSQQCGEAGLRLDSDCGSAFSSLESLAEMTVCPVHCGRMDRPKVLPCGHVFCVTCLDKWSERQGGRQIECPMCRRCCQKPEAGAAGLPTARGHQAILDYLITHAARRVSAPSKDGQQRQRPHQPQDDPPPPQSAKRRKRPSLELRQDLLTHLSNDLARRADSSEPGAFDREELSGVMDNLQRVMQRLDAAATLNQREGGVVGGGAVEASDDTNDDDDDDPDDADAVPGVGGSGGSGIMSPEATDIFSATQREMRRRSRYRMRELPVAWSREFDADAGGIADAGLIRWPASGQAGGRRATPALLLLGGLSRNLLLQRGARQQLTRLTIDQSQLQAPSGPGEPSPTPPSNRLRVVSMRVARGSIYLTGWLGRTCVLAVVSAEEAPRVLRCHARSEATEAAAAQGFAGFHVEASGPATVVAAQPGRQRVEFFDENLQPTGHWLVFDRLTPRHVAWASQLGTLWVSCPDERLVLAVNDRTGVFRKLSTGDIFQSAPAQIVAAQMPDGDCRVVLADSEQGRLYWIRKRRKYIFLQRLQLPRELPDIASLSALDGGCLLVTSRGGRLYRLKPRCPRDGGQRRNRCQLL